MSKQQKSILFNTSAGTDVQYVGGEIQIPGLDSIRQSRIVDFSQVMYRAEVVQVVTVGATSYTPTAGTRYIVTINDVRVRRQGLTGQPLTYTYTTPPDITTLGATAALQREAIHLGLVADINAVGYNYVVAASLGTGTGFTITDDAGYFPVNSQTMTNREGASTIKLMTDIDGRGFAITNIALTTAAVYASGVGATLASSAPVYDLVYTNLISGYIDGPKTIAGATAVSGQKYNLFSITYMKEVSMPTAPSYTCFTTETAQVWVDNGTGSSVTNLAGYKEFERKMHKGMVAKFANDPATVIEWFDAPIAFQDPLGAAPTGTADTLGWMVSKYGALNCTNINTQTIVSPVLNDLGLLIDQDDTATDGRHVSASQQTIGAQQIVVGKQEATLMARVVMGDWTDAAFMIGFRKKAAYTAVINNYTDYATIGNGSSAAGTTWINGDLFVTRAAINSGAVLQTISAVAPVDAVSVLLVVKVALSGAVTAFVDGVSYPIYSAGTTAMVFDTGDVLIPFYQHVNIGGGDPAAVISEFIEVPSTRIIS